MRRLFPFLSVPLLVAFVSLVACQSESEGYPCDKQNGNDDCADGLECVQPPNPTATNASAVCCPVAGQSPTTPECSLNGQVDAGNPAPPDAATFPETSTDGATTTTDAPHDSSGATDTGVSPSDAGPG